MQESTKKEVFLNGVDAEINEESSHFLRMVTPELLDQLPKMPTASTSSWHASRMMLRAAIINFYRSFDVERYAKAFQESKGQIDDITKCVWGRSCNYRKAYHRKRQKARNTRKLLEAEYKKKARHEVYKLRRSQERQVQKQLRRQANMLKNQAAAIADIRASSMACCLGLILIGITSILSKA